MTKLEQLTSMCQGDTVYIQTHNFPDPDAIGSAYGLQKLLEQCGIHSIICYDGCIDKLSASKMLSAFNIVMHSYSDIRESLSDSDKIIYVDTQKFAGNVTDFVGNEIACIDHHPTIVTTDYQFRDVQIVGSCCTILATYYQESGIELTSDVATALLYGLKMDTLQFTRGVSPLDIAMFGFLFPYCNQEKLDDLERNNMEFSDLRAYGAAIEDITLYRTVGFSAIHFSCPDALIAILSDFLLSLVEVEVAVVFSFRLDGIKLSVRSEDPTIHAGNLLSRALNGVGNGGGHACMAGGLIPASNVELLGNLPDYAIRERILQVLGAIQESN